MCWSLEWTYIGWGYSQLRHEVPNTMFFFVFGLCCAACESPRPSYLYFHPPFLLPRHPSTNPIYPQSQNCPIVLLFYSVSEFVYSYISTVTQKLNHALPTLCQLPSADRQILFYNCKKFSRRYLQLFSMELRIVSPPISTLCFPSLW
jgi:hypothetical protein